MNSDIDVSIIMSSYNEEVEHIEKSIFSILNQSFRNFEFIIVLDNPNNKILNNYIKSIDDNRIVIIENDRNMGLPNSLNKALKVARGTFIARMDADDISLNSRIEEQYKYMSKNKDIALLGTDVFYIDEYGNQIDRFIKNSILTSFDKIKEKMKIGNEFFHPTLMIRKDIIVNEKINGYRNIFAAEYYDLICRIINNGYKVENLNKQLLFYRVRKNGISKSNDFVQFKTSMLISKLYKKEILSEATEKYICDVSLNESGLNNYIRANKIKEFYKGNSKFIKIMLYVLADIISKYHFIRAYRNFYWKIKCKFI